jgi:hypothetical protein
MGTFVLIVEATGRMRREPFDAKDSLSQLQRGVGGYIERLPIWGQNDIDCFINEEGKLKGLAFNPVLTRYYRGLFPTLDWVSGRGIFAAHDGEGETIGLTEAQCEDLKRMLARYGAFIEKGGAS